jgi:hypothetical protein
MPFRFNPVNPKSPQDHLISMINQNFAKLDGEAVTKIFYESKNIPGVIIGKLPNNMYGILMYLDGIPNAIWTAQTGLKIAEPGTDVLTLV